MFGHALYNSGVMLIQHYQASFEIDPTIQVTWMDLLKMTPLALIALFVVLFIFRRLEVGKLMEPAKVKLRWYDIIRASY